MNKSPFNLRHLFISICFLFTLAVPIVAQQPYSKSEFLARRAKLFEKIPDGVAVVFAARSKLFPVKFRQSSVVSCLESLCALCVPLRLCG